GDLNLVGLGAQATAEAVAEALRRERAELRGGSRGLALQALIRITSFAEFAAEAEHRHKGLVFLEGLLLSWASCSPWHGLEGPSDARRAPGAPGRGAGGRRAAAAGRGAAGPARAAAAPARAAAAPRRRAAAARGAAGVLLKCHARRLTPRQRRERHGSLAQ
ncbi:unnamed protein product, partial [Prorocentrum cordatum]